ncbi:MAG: hypothetical protein QXL94_00035, partial [Candidatus Parvarchaeum sp.]
TLAAGLGIGVSGLTISNTGVYSINGLKSTTKIDAGTGITVSTGTTAITVSNSGVLSLQGDTGALSLVAGTGISISGLTITNTGITSLTAGTGISVSGSTITNTGVLSLQGDTGALSLVAGTGISISGLTITNSSPGVDYPAQANTWSSTQAFLDSIYIGTGIVSSVVDTRIGVFPYETIGSILGAGISPITFLGGGDIVGGFIGENYDSVQIGMYNRTSTTQGALAGNSWSPFFEITYGGEVFTSSSVNAAIGTSNSINGSARNILDDGSGNMTVAGNLTAETFYTSGQGAVMFTGTSVVNGAGVTGGISFEGRPRIGDWGEWLEIGEPNGTNGGLILQITSAGIFTGTSAGITDSPTIRNTLDNGSGDMTVTGSLTAGSYNLTGGTGISFSGTTITNTGIISASAGNGISVSGTNPLSIAMSGSYSGNMSVSGVFTAQYINANIGNLNPNGATPTIVLSIFGDNEGAVNSNTYGLGISNGTLDFITESGQNFAWWEGTSQIASLNASGNLNIKGSFSGKTASVGNLQNYTYNGTIQDDDSLELTVTAGASGMVTFYGWFLASANNTGFWGCLTPNGVVNIMAGSSIYGYLSAGNSNTYGSEGDLNFIMGYASGLAPYASTTVYITNLSGSSREIYSYALVYTGV